MSTSALALDELDAPRLLVEVAGPPVVYHFAHALVRDTIVQHASSAGRAHRHRRVAEAIERVYEADRRPVLAELARHYVEAAALGDTERAIYYARRAATQAMRSHAYEEAIVHLEAAQALSPPGSPEHVQLLLDLGTCRTRSGFDPRAMTLFETAFEAARDLGLVRETASAVLGLSRHGVARATRRGRRSTWSQRRCACWATTIRCCASASVPRRQQRWRWPDDSTRRSTLRGRCSTRRASTVNP